MIQTQLAQIEREGIESINKAVDVAEVEGLRVALLGKKGALTAILKQMGGLSAEERPKMGKLANEVRSAIEERMAQRFAELSSAARQLQMNAESIDITLPGTPLKIGHRHPIQRVLEDITEIFLGMGFDVVDGPEIELTEYVFDMLNTPFSHPARDPSDTFYIREDVLLRTQTSSVQIRTMQQQKPPIRIISPGRVYRRDTVDGTHSPVFHQIEGLVVDKGVSMADLKGTLDAFAKKLYGDTVTTRFRPHHFPYTEPSAEMDATCFVCKGSGCRLCKGEGFIELLGCGMVHPKVLQGCGVDSDVYSGFAFGMGLDRVTMMRYGIDDLRLMFENDLRFLRQF